jgi:ketosteroid isomerase-like protein
MLYTRILWACVAVVAASIGWMVWAPNSHKADERGAAKAAVEQYVAAFAKGDGNAACDHLTNTAREAVIALSGKVGAASCPQAFERTRRLGGSKVVAIANQIRVGKVDVSGSRAKVTIKAAGQDSVVELDKGDGKWKIASLPRS